MALSVYRCILVVVVYGEGAALFGLVQEGRGRDYNSQAPVPIGVPAPVSDWTSSPGERGWALVPGKEARQLLWLRLW